MSKIDPYVEKAVKEYGLDPKKALWNCHGTWVAYHWAIEQIAAKAGIEFDPPQVLEADGKNKTCALCVTARTDQRVEWSIGEASPANNKNSYPFAMAEKRAKDRVVLKLIGLSGFVYSEEEADDFKASKPAEQSAPATSTDPATEYMTEARKIIDGFTNVQGARTWWKNEAPHRGKAGLSSEQMQELIDAIGNKFPATLSKEEAA